MIHAEVKIRVRVPQELVWNRITDWESHSRWIPFTKVTILEEGTADCTVGTRFVGRTGIGWFAFDDIMRVDRCVSPAESGEDGKCWISKNSPYLSGSADFHVTRLDAELTEITWVENIVLERFSRLHRWSGVLSWIATAAFRISLRGFARLTEREYSQKP